MATAPENKTRPDAKQKRKGKPRGKPFPKGNTAGKRFQPGVSGNPGGRPAGLAEVRALAQAHSTEAIETLVEIMRNPDAKDVDRRGAADSILDRAVGKPGQGVEITGKGGRPLSFRDLSRVSDEELDRLEAIAASTVAGTAAGETGGSAPDA
jgi:hypothetical protein